MMARLHLASFDAMFATLCFNFLRQLYGFWVCYESLFDNGLCAIDDGIIWIPIEVYDWILLYIERSWKSSPSFNFYL
jgi:hypothetical protein